MLLQTTVKGCLKEVEKDLKKLKAQVQRMETKQDMILTLLKESEESSFSIGSSQYKASIKNCLLGT